MRCFSRWLVAGLALLLCLAGIPAFSADSPVIARIVKTGELRVAMTGSQPPLNVKDKHGKLIGFEVDLARMLASSMGVKARFVVKPFAKLLPALNAGEVDVVMSGVTITPERNMKAAFVGPYFVTGKSILTTSKQLAKARRSKDINDADLTLAALEGSTSELFVKRVVPLSKLVTVPDYETGLDLVKRGKANALVADLQVCLFAVLRNPGAGLTTLAEPLTIEPIGVAAPPNDPLFVNLLTNLFNAMQGTGVLKDLQQKWFEDPSWLDQLPEPAEAL